MVADPADLTPEATKVPDLQLYIGKVAEDAGALGDEIFVTIPDFHKHLKHGPCPWTPRPLPGGDIDKPSKGDKALIAVVDHEVWIVAWWPYG